MNSQTTPPDSVDTPDASAAPSPADAKPFMRTIKSFVKRAGCTTTGQAKACEVLGPNFLRPCRQNAVNSEAIYVDPIVVAGQSISIRAPVVLEIGFCMGDVPAHIAGVLPDTRFLCCEVIDHMLPLCSLDGVHIFIAGPWHKTKRNRRSLIQSPPVGKLAHRFKVLPALRDPLGALCPADRWRAH